MTTKKHARDYESDNEEYEYGTGKRIKLDKLFEDLQLDEEKVDDRAVDNDTDSFILPQFKSPFGGGVFKSKTSPRTYTSSQIDSYINEKILNHFHNIITSGLKVIPWYNYRFLVLYRLQRWFIKLFNRFIKKYNSKSNTSIKPFKSHEQILQLVRDGLLSWNELGSIIAEENKLEIKRLLIKEEKRQARRDDKRIQEETEAYKDLGYNYWDNLDFDRDLDMLDEDVDGSKFALLPADIQDDVAMAEEEDAHLHGVEANYGSYYYKD